MTAYYNEFDPGAAAWLRELTRAGLIADGEVDERSILEVSADDLRGFTQCHFFAGIGGWSHALRLAGWPDDRPVWTGSPPCQPFSAAGQQKGRNDDRHLAPHFISLVGSARPGVLFGEQVASAEVFGKAAKPSRGNFVSPPQWAWLDDLSDRLEAARYAVGASDFSSAGVGAPHIRQRTFFGAVSHEWLADSDGAGRLSGAQRGIHRSEEGAGPRHGEPERFGDAGGLVHGIGAGLEGHGGHGDRSRQPGRLDEDTAGSVGASGAAGGMADDAGGGRGKERQDGRGCAFRDSPEGISAGLGAGCRDSGLADADGRDARAEWQQCGGQQRQQPQDGGVGDGGRRPGPVNGFWGTADWLHCRDAKWRPVEPGTFPLAHGVSGRVGLLRGYGNAINPWAAAQFIGAFTEASGHIRLTEETDVFA